MDACVGWTRLRNGCLIRLHGVMMAGRAGRTCGMGELVEWIERGGGPQHSKYDMFRTIASVQGAANRFFAHTYYSKLKSK